MKHGGIQEAWSLVLVVPFVKEQRGCVQGHRVCFSFVISVWEVGWGGSIRALGLDLMI